MFKIIIIHNNLQRVLIIAATFSPRTGTEYISLCKKLLSDSKVTMHFLWNIDSYEEKQVYSALTNILCFTDDTLCLDALVKSVKGALFTTSRKGFCSPSCSLGLKVRFLFLFCFLRHLKRSIFIKHSFKALIYTYNIFDPVFPTWKYLVDILIWIPTLKRNLNLVA